MKSFPKIADYLLGALLMSFAWSLRGQFGHLKGALIPGAAAALIIIFLHREEIWRKSFGWAVVLGGLGFSLGGHLAYGALIDKIIATPTFAETIPGLARIFFIGAVWGGLGSTFLGFAVSEKPLTQQDLLLLAFLGLIWFIPLGIFNQEAFDLLLFGAGFALMHVYNLKVKKSKEMGVLGAAGFFGFGGGFLISVLLLYFGQQGTFGNSWPWWHLRDQIFGAIGGASLVLAVHALKRFDFFPPPNIITLATQKGGLIFFLIFIPVVNSLGVIDFWFFERALFSNSKLLVAGFVLTLLFGSLLLVLTTLDLRLLVGKALDWVLYLVTVFFSAYLTAAAILKNIVAHGFSSWETSYTFCIIAVVLFAVFLPVWIFRPQEEEPDLFISDYGKN